VTSDERDNSPTDSDIEEILTIFDKSYSTKQDNTSLNGLANIKESLIDAKKEASSNFDYVSVPCYPKLEAKNLTSDFNKSGSIGNLASFLRNKNDIHSSSNCPKMNNNINKSTEQLSNSMKSKSNMEQFNANLANLDLKLKNNNAKPVFYYDNKNRKGEDTNTETEPNRALRRCFSFDTMIDDNLKSNTNQTANFFKQLETKKNSDLNKLMSNSVETIITNDKNYKQTQAQLKSFNNNKYSHPTSSNNINFKDSLKNQVTTEMTEKLLLKFLLQQITLQKDQRILEEKNILNCNSYNNNSNNIKNNKYINSKYGEVPLNLFDHRKMKEGSKI
jgi:hypothetical protein